ncbi:uncharacterized protein LOC132552828 [Ylistrum balloti]|uniref:uncharacterized protein LOC132552828 n=1 Tax=Ylistrum balloti TaxID=509963 RepID=UPI002905DA69|nr:uncharacterized protein LOC132552828 [Ylistrum balloti]
MERISRSSRLDFRNLVVSIKSKTLLHSVSGLASSGDLLAVMGPSGAGKTTLLNALARRIPCDSGTITLNGMPFNKEQRGRLGYVSQTDVFLSNLTLWETLYFTAMIRIPDDVPKQEKIAKIQAIVEILGLQMCLHTIVGDLCHRGLSGGEKKRANIACEILTDPDILLVDEPTSGLDSSSANSLMLQLKQYATKYNKTIIASVHQPSSQIFHMFSNLLLLKEGKMVYFGLADKVLQHFVSLGLTCDKHHNPADFLLQVLTADRSTKADDEGNRANHSLHPIPFGSDIENGHNPTENDRERRIWTSGVELLSVMIKSSDGSTTNCNHVLEEEMASRWPTSLWNQFKLLSWRSYRQSKGRLLHKFEVLLTAFIAAFLSVIFFQVEDSIITVRDRMGLVMSSLLFWSFRIEILTILGFNADRAVLSKDYAAGTYRMLAYYLAKMASEMPLLLVLPFLFNTVVYWMTGLGGVDGYFVFLCIGTLNCLLMQSVAHNLAVLIKDVKLSTMTGNVLILGGLVLGGFLNINPPEWLFWTKYLTLAHYPYAAAMTYILKDMDAVWCNQTSVGIYFKCKSEATEFLTSRDILLGIGVDLPIYCYISTIVLAIFIFNVFGYYALKWKGE